MGNIEIIQSNMNMQTISFYDKRKDELIKRTIVYSNSIPQQEIYEYFLISISRKVALEFGEIEPCVCYFELHELIKNNDCRIDYYWMDAGIYLTNKEQKNKEEESKNKPELFILTTNLEDEKQINFVNRLGNCWIKRQGNEYETINV